MGRPDNLHINPKRLSARITMLAEFGAIAGGGVCRLALTDEDRAGRDRVVSWMRACDLEISIDRIGNVFGIRPGIEDTAPVMTGSHLDSVRAGGPYDGSLGVLAGLEVIATLNDAGIATRHPLAVAFFTNEEGARFAPDMMGSMVHQGALDLEKMLAVKGVEQTTVGENLKRIGYMGSLPCGAVMPRAYIELHVEQGPILDREGIRIGAVQGVQGISWTEIIIDGLANHAGTTPMILRHDAGFAAAAITTAVRRLSRDFGGDLVATVGVVDLHPNMVNVIPGRARMTVDMRHASDTELREAERRLHVTLDEIADREGVQIARRQMARFKPVAFDPDIVALVEREARKLGTEVRRMHSGAGHDAQSFAPNCPTGMIFVPSVDGISHNVAECTAPDDIALGADVLLNVLMDLAG